MFQNNYNDPLYVIFERHLFKSSTEDQSTQNFVDDVVNDYIQFLKSQSVGIPRSMLNYLIDDLKEEVRDMTLKKTYGTASLREFRSQQNLQSKRRRVS